MSCSAFEIIVVNKFWTAPPFITVINIPANATEHKAIIAYSAVADPVSFFINDIF